jgi:hypothetical protein
MLLVQHEQHRNPWAIHNTIRFKYNQKNEKINIGIESFSERFTKIGRVFIKILETWQFVLSFNIIKTVFFCFGQ